MLCAVDIETTKSDVLVVGAPFYGNLTHKNIDINHINQDEGKVYVYYFDKAEVSLNKILCEDQLWTESLNSDGQEFHQYQQN